MNGILLTQQDGFLGPIANILGYLMNYIFIFLDAIKIPNIGLAIILFTIVIYLFLTPLTYRQQKFSKLSARMQPELSKVQAKYKGKKDNESVMALNEETKAIYDKYGVSPTGSCIQLIIQMPILFSLYRVIYNIPAYVPMIKDAFTGLVGAEGKAGCLLQIDGISDFLKGLETSAQHVAQFTNELFTGFFSGADKSVEAVTYVQNTFIDCLNKMSSGSWSDLGNMVNGNTAFPDAASSVASTYHTLDQYNTFLGLNIGNSPSFTLAKAWDTKDFIMIAAALSIPVLAAVSQWVSVKLMPSAPKSGNEATDNVANSMKTMNVIMPVMSAVFCFTLPAGMGIYWIAGAVVRCVQQVIINRFIDKIDMNALVEKNKDKAKKKAEKRKEKAEKVQGYAGMKTRNSSKLGNSTEDEKAAAAAKALAYSQTARPDSISARAHLVKKYNDGK